MASINPNGRRLWRMFRDMLSGSRHQPAAGSMAVLRPALISRFFASTTPMIHVDPSELSIARRARVISEFQASIADAPSRFRVGDIITYEDAEGWHRIVTILLTTNGGGALVMVYDGLPHYEAVKLEDLYCLRVLKIDRMGPRDVASYLSLMNPADEAEEMELAA